MPRPTQPSIPPGFVNEYQVRQPTRLSAFAGLHIPTPEGSRSELAQAPPRWVNSLPTTVTEITVVSCSDCHASPGNWKRSRLWASNSRPLCPKAAMLTTTPPSHPLWVSLATGMIRLTIYSCHAGLYLSSTMGGLWGQWRPTAPAQDNLPSGKVLGFRRIFVTKTKIKTKMIPFRFIKTKTKTISFQKTKTK